MMMMEPPMGETSMYKSHEAPALRQPLPPTMRLPVPPSMQFQVHENNNNNVEEAEPVTEEEEIERTPVASREIAEETVAAEAAPVQLHRDSKVPGPIRETVSACKQACKGVAYDIKHWKRLPGKSVGEKVKIVTTRGGRLPYLVLTFSIAFLIFFAIVHCIRWMGGRGRREKMIVFREAAAASAPPLAGQSQPSVTGGFRVGPANVPPAV